MKRKLRTIQDVVDWNLCIGCGACVSICSHEGGVELVDVGSAGIRPRFSPGICQDCSDCLAVCPGVAIDAADTLDDEAAEVEENLLIGSHHGVYEGHAADPEVRFQGSSGGILSALAAYCLEHESMDFVVHTAMDETQPWKNKTVISRSREELLANAGSRYCTSSPCEFLHLIEKNDKPCVFIGKPCDVAALAKARKIRPELDRKVGLSLSFFCAGTPCSDAVRDLAGDLGAEQEAITYLRFRGQGWPGSFRVETGEGEPRTMAYLSAWKILAKRRPFRCHICPDGMGQLSDITSGDAWNKYTGEGESPGLSHVILRTGRGRRILEKAVAAGYLQLEQVDAENIIESQGLVLRRTLAYGRLVGMSLCGVPTTSFKNFKLFKAWISNNPLTMVKSIGGTLKRMVVRKLWKKSSLFYR